MMDHLWKARQALIENFQVSMKAIRLLMGYTIIDLAEYVGVTRQTITNLETGKSKMSVMQFLSLAAVVDNYILINGEMYQAIAAILDGGGKKIKGRYDSSFSSFSLLRRWFLLFEGTGSEVVPNGKQSLDASQIQQMARDYKVFLDDTVLLSEGAEGFLQSWVNHLAAEKTKLIIPLRAIEQIQEQAQDADCSQRAVNALRLLNWMQQKNLVQIRGEESDVSLHDTILSVFFKFRGTHRLCLITQDKAFATEILRLNKMRGQSGFSIAVGYIDGGGDLVMYADGGESPSLSRPPLPETAEKDDLASWEYL